MAFDECAPAKAERAYVENSVARTTRWLERCKAEMARLNSQEDTINKNQLLFGINQGAIYTDIRIEHAKRISALNLDGYAVGGLAVGESHEEMYHVLDETVPYLPVDKPTYLMGVGTPANILEGVERGIDFFDCVYPSRNGRHGHLYTCLLYTSCFRIMGYNLCGICVALMTLNSEDFKYGRKYIRNLFQDHHLGRIPWESFGGGN